MTAPKPFPVLIPAIVLLAALFVPWPWGFLPAGHVFAYWWWVVNAK